MARIAGIDLPREKRVEVALTYIFGIGQTTARKLLDFAASIRTCASKRSAKRTRRSCAMRSIALSLRVEGDLRREVQGNIKRLMDIGCYRGMRHRRGLPVRGQRTKTNARTRKGPKRTVAGKKKTIAKK